MSTIETTPGNGGPPPILPVASPDEDALHELLRVLQAAQAGDFSVRLPGHWTGLHGKIADSVNDVVAANEKMAEQLERVGDAVGRKGRTKQRVRFGRPL